MSQMFSELCKFMVNKVTFVSFNPELSPQSTPPGSACDGGRIPRFFPSVAPVGYLKTTPFKCGTQARSHRGVLGQWP